MSPAGIKETDTLVLANEPAWHRLGTVLDTNGEKGLTVERALEASGIDWEVQKAPTLGFGLKLSRQVSSYNDFAQKVKSGGTLKWSDLVWVQDNHNVQRQTDGSVLGVVGNSWEPVQNREGFEVIQAVIEKAGGRCWIESAGALDDGRRVWVLARVESDLLIAGEPYFSYILFSNGHNGRASVTAALTDIRVVCANTLDWALGQAKKDERIVRVRHTTTATERLEQAAHILGLRDRRAEILAQEGEFLADTSWDEGEFNNFLETLMPVPDGQEGKPAETMIHQRQDKVRALYMDAPNLQPLQGTVWGGLQAVVEYSDYEREFKSDETQLKAVFGWTQSGLKQSAHDLAVAFAAAA